MKNIKLNIIQYFSTIVTVIMLLCSCDQIVTKSVEVTTTTTTIAYIVEFNAGEGSGAAIQYNVIGDEKVTVPPCGFTPPLGKKFGYWQMTAASTDGQSRTFAVGDVISHLSAMNSATVVIRAVWIDKDTLTLTYRNYYPSTGGSLTKEFRESDTVILTDATADCFVFGGWYDVSGDVTGDRIYGWYAGDVLTDKAVTGLWTAVSYKVHFDSNMPDGSSGSSTMNEMTFVTNEEKPLIANTFTAPTGMKFNCWNTKQDGSGTSYADCQTVCNLTNEQNIVLFAQWIDKAAHRISYYNLKNADNTLNPTSFLESENVALKKMSDITGYTFCGWYTAENDGNEVKGWLSGAKTDDISLWARWQAMDYKVQFDANGGSGVMVDMICVTDESKDLTVNTFIAPTGKKFGSWNTKRDGSGMSYADGQSICNLTTEQSIVLFAQWIDKAAHRISYYNLKTGDNTLNPTSFLESENIALKKMFDITGYTFLGWYDDENVGTLISGWLAGEKSADISLWARWQPMSYKVQFDGNGGSGVMADMSLVTDESKDLTANAFTAPTGMKFGSWNTKRDGSGTSYADVQTVCNLTTDRNIFLFAQWIDKDAHRISYYNLKNGDNTLNPTSFNESENVSLKKMSDVTGYSFQGWWNAENDGEEVSSWTVGEVTRDVSLWARWTPYNYTIVFDSNGGVGTMASQKMTYDTAASLTANTFTKVGYEFAGWATSASGAKVYNNSQSVKNLTADNGETVTLYAKWTPIAYTVTFDKNGGTSGTMSNQTIIYDTATALIANGFSRTGYTFQGWSTNSSATSASYANKASVLNLSTTAGSSVTLYAVWKVNTYSIVFNAGDGTGTMANQAMIYDVAANLSGNAFTKTGYTFGGWAKTEAGTKSYNDKQSVSKLSKTNNSTVNLYAVWTANSYSVAFNANGGTGTMANLSMTYDTAKTLTANTFTRTGYTFAGWNTKADGSGTSYTDKQSVNNLTTVSGGSVTLYAVWTPKSYTVTYKNIGGGAYTGNNSSSLPATHTYGTATVIPAGKTDDATFLGWYTSSDGMSEPISVLGETAYTANITLYAQWTGTITLNHDGGTSSQSSLDINTGEKKVVTPPTKTNYVFQGYYTERLGKGTQYFDADGNPTKAWDLSSNTVLYAGYKMKAMTNLSASLSGTVVNISWTSPLSTYHIVVSSSSRTITSNTSGGSTSWACQINNAYIGSSITVKGLYYDSNSVGGEGVETTKTISVAEPFFVINKVKMEKSGLKQVISSSKTITCDQADGVFPTARGSVTLGKYAIGKYEVTQQLYTAVMGSNPSHFTETIISLVDGETNALLRPVEKVSWYDAITFCNKLSILVGKTRCYKLSDGTYPEDFGTIPESDNIKWDNATCDWTVNGYRLPTECEWECAARGGTYSAGTPWTYTYSGSNTAEDVAWCFWNSISTVIPTIENPVNFFFGTHTREVGLKSANTLGLYDMSGNVQEWCWDLQAAIDGSTPATGPATSSSSYFRRIHRGGSYSDIGPGIALSMRLSHNQYEGTDRFGFRIACNQE